jgi:hypothetical protein
MNKNRSKKSKRKEVLGRRCSAEPGFLNLVGCCKNRNYPRRKSIKSSFVALKTKKPLLKKNLLTQNQHNQEG